MAIKKVTGLLKRLSLLFWEAVLWHCEPEFREAAEGSGDSGGAKWHKWAPIGLPGAKFHAMTGQMEKSHDVRRSRAEGRGFRAQVLNRPDYYGSFEKVNSLKM